MYILYSFKKMKSELLLRVIGVNPGSLNQFEGSSGKQMWPVAIAFTCCSNFPPI